MKREGAEGLAAVSRVSPAATQEFTEMVNGVDRLAPPSIGLGSLRSVADPRQGILHCDARAQTCHVTLAGEVRAAEGDGCARPLNARPPEGVYPTTTPRIHLHPANPKRRKRFWPRSTAAH